MKEVIDEVPETRENARRGSEGMGVGEGGDLPLSVAPTEELYVQGRFPL